MIGCFEEDFSKTGDDDATKEISLVSDVLLVLNTKTNGSLEKVVQLHQWSGAKGSAQCFWGGNGYVALVGLGKKEDALGEKIESSVQSVWRSLGNAVKTHAKSCKASTVGVGLTVQGLEGKDGLVAEHVANGIVNGGYEATRFKSKPTEMVLKTVELLFAGEGAGEAIAKGAALGHGALFTRYLVEAPANVCTPTYLASAAQHIAGLAPEHMKLEVLEKEDCEKLGMGLYLGVAEASDEPPKFIHLTYSKGQASRKIAIVGKGLTFDSGGYNLKAGAGSMIEMMKFDMGGSAATLGAARAIAEIKPEGFEIHFIIASCENMVDGRGLRPGDILVASNGKTVEVNNTDAEGRLTLADALLFAQNQCKAEYIIDIATLTGACMIALGGEIGGMYASTDEVAQQLKAAAQVAGEKIWQMPLEDSYMEQLKSPIADMKNTGGRMGGSITAALFLKEFVDLEKTKWSHLDIAGPVWNDKVGGATGFGAQLLAEWAINHSS